MPYNKRSKGTQFRKGVSGNPAGRKPGVPSAKPSLSRDIVKMAHDASPEIMQRMINLALGKVKKASIESQLKACIAVHERAYGRPPQIVSLDIALKRAVEHRDPVEQLRILRDMRASWENHLASPPVVEVEAAE